MIRQELWTGLIALSGFLFFGLGYSMPPIRAKARPFFDSFFNILYIFPGLLSYGLLAQEFPPLHLVIAATLWTMAMHAYSAVPDIAADKKAGIATIATKLGRSATIIFCAFAYLLAAALSFSELGVLSVIGSIVYGTMMVLSYRAQTDKELFSLYKAFPYINLTIGTALFWYIIIVF
jgi:4-hydroxybenzoate polyprenyltransferase